MPMELVTQLPYDHPYRWDGTLFGGPKLWRPTELAGSLALWLDAEDAASITLNGSTVSQWNDKSGNGRNAVQATAANQPTYSLAAINGKNALSWPLTANPQFVATSQNVTAQDIYTVIRYADGTQSTWATTYQGVFGDASGAFIGLVGDVAATSKWFTGNGYNNLRKDGGESQNTSLAPGVVALPLTTSIINVSRVGAVTIPMAIGMDRNRSNLNRGWSGLIAEVIMLSSLASTVTRQQLEGYLAWKWGLQANLPADHPYKLLPPTV